MQICLARASEHRLYRQITGTISFDFSWELTASDTNVLEVNGNDEFYQNICDQELIKSSPNCHNYVTYNHLLFVN